MKDNQSNWVVNIVDNMENIIEYLNKMNGNNVYIEIDHKLFGNQKIECALTVINDEERIGASIKGHDIYIYKSEVRDLKFRNKLCELSDDLMSIKISIKTLLTC